jgi:hypothetical protein
MVMSESGTDSVTKRFGPDRPQTEQLDQGFVANAQAHLK